MIVRSSNPFPSKETAMAELKTKATDASVEDYIRSRASAEQREDCRKLMATFRKLTKRRPKMWGSSIVGYGSYRYTYESGRTGEMCPAAFAIRGRELVVYLLAESKEQKALLARLGPHRMGKSCLYLKRLDDIDAAVLERLIVGSIAEIGRRYRSASSEDRWANGLNRPEATFLRPSSCPPCS